MPDKPEPTPFHDPMADDCYPSRREGEPSFTLLGRDIHSYLHVKQWALHRQMLVDMGLKPKEDQRSIDNALEIADAMRIYALARNNLENRQFSIDFEKVQTAVGPLETEISLRIQKALEQDRKNLVGRR